MEPDLSKVIEVNKRQAAFYDQFHTDSAMNLASRLWRRSRQRVRAIADINPRVYAFQREVVAALRPKRILEVGCWEGTEFGVWMIEELKPEAYVGIELSAKALERFAAKIPASCRARVDLRAEDFLTADLAPASFDLVYMHGVLHHFPDAHPVLRRVAELLAPGGCYLTFDPLNTSTPFKLARALYRPFQSDRDWEWPLTRETFPLIQERFEITRVQGFLGAEMYAAVLHALLPTERTRRYVSQARTRDERLASSVGPQLFGCNSVAMAMQLRRRP